MKPERPLLRWHGGKWLLALERTECLWLNAAAIERLGAGPLFDRSAA